MAKATQLLPELLAGVRRTFPPGSPQLARQLASLGRSLLDAKAFNDAEPLLHECLAIREKTQPEDWLKLQRSVYAGRRCWARRNTPPPSRCSWRATRG